MSKKLIIAVILAKDNKILMEVNNRYKNHKNCWQFPGGKVEPGEILKVAAIRELKEELDITVNENDLTNVTFNSYIRNNQQYIIFYYFCNKWEGQLKNYENQTIQWFDLNQVTKDILVPCNHNIITYLNGFLKNTNKNT